MDIFDTIMSSKGREKPKASNIVDNASSRPPEISTRSMEIFSGIPEKNKQEMWDASIEEGGNGKKILSFLTNGKVLNFELEDGELGDGKGVAYAKRLPDADRHDFGTRGEAITTRFQTFNTSPGKIYGTWQNGKKSMTFSLERDGDTNRWVIKKKGEADPLSSVSSLIKSVSIDDKVADEYGRFADRITAPLTSSSPGVAYTASALIGAGVMGAKNIGEKVYNAILGGGIEDTSSIRNDLLMGAAGGMLGTGGIRMIGGIGDGKIDSGNKKRDAMYIYSNYVKNSGDRLTAEEIMRNADDLSIFLPENSYRLHKTNGFTIRPRTEKELQLEKSGEEREEGMDKVASLQSVEQIKMMLQYDPSLTYTDKMILIQQLSAAIRNAGTPSGMLDLGMLKGLGFGALFGYIVSKIAGAGMYGQVGSTLLGSAIGGLVASGGSAKHQPKTHRNGYQYYEYE